MIPLVLLLACSPPADNGNATRRGSPVAGGDTSSDTASDTAVDDTGEDTATDTSDPLDTSIDTDYRPCAAPYLWRGEGVVALTPT